jgi:uncharacterized phage protein gp47/JayE
MSDQSSIAAQMIQALSVVEPDLDTSIGSTVRNIIDVVADQQAQGAADNNIAQYQYAVDTLSGAALDAWTANFGFVRYAARRATGIVTFTQNAAMNQLPMVVIPSGTAIATPGGVVFQTSSTYSFLPVPNNPTSIDIPVVATIGGSNTNVPAATITNLVTPLSPINTVTNSAGTSGGADAESDTSYRSRFKSTIFRSFLGTSSSFLGVATDNANVSLANVIGAISTHQEQIQITGGTGKSVLNDIAFLYPQNQFMATDLSVSTANVTTGSITIPAAIPIGFFTGPLIVTEPILLPQGTLIQLPLSDGSLNTVVTQFMSVASTSIPIESFELFFADFAGGAVTYIVNTGQFLNSGIDFSLSTSPVMPNPTSGPTLTQFTGSGPAFSSGTVLQYAIAYGNSNGLTAISPYNSITITGSGDNFVQLSLSVQNGIYSGSPYNLNLNDLVVYIYRLKGGILQILSVVPASVSSVFLRDTNITATPTVSVIPPTTNDTGEAVTVTSLNSTTCPDGIYQIQFDYIPPSSRNVYPSILNCVDIYVAGSREQNASESISFYNGPVVSSGPLVCSNPKFTANPSDVMFVGNFQREDLSIPLVGDYLIPLSFSPLSTIPTTIVSPSGNSSGATLPITYTLGADYWLVNETSTTGMSNSSICGIEWGANLPFGAGFTSLGGNMLPNNPGYAVALTIPYTFNAVPLQIANQIGTWRLMSHDVMVHQAYPLLLNVNLIVVFAPGSQLSSVIGNIETDLEAYFSTLGFNSILESSTVINTVLNVSGVQNARLALFTDNATNYGITSEVTSSLEGVITTYYFNTTTNTPADIEFTSTVYPVLNAVNVTAVAQNVFLPGGYTPLRPVNTDPVGT